MTHPLSRLLYRVSPYRRLPCRRRPAETTSIAASTGAGNCVVPNELSLTAYNPRTWIHLAFGIAGCPAGRWLQLLLRTSLLRCCFHASCAVAQDVHRLRGRQGLLSRVRILAAAALTAQRLATNGTTLVPPSSCLLLSNLSLQLFLRCFAFTTIRLLVHRGFKFRRCLAHSLVWDMLRHDWTTELENQLSCLPTCILQAIILISISLVSSVLLLLCCIVKHHALHDHTTPTLPEQCICGERTQIVSLHGHLSVRLILRNVESNNFTRSSRI